MGLKVSTISRLPLDTGRDYFVYFLDYGWTDPFSDALYQNFDRLASGLSGHRGVVVAGLNRQEFADEVLSWHRVNNEPASEILPAILISGCHPAEFNERNEFSREWRKSKSGARKYQGAILLPLREVCRTPDDVPIIIAQILQSIQDRQAIEGFEFGRVSKGRHGDPEMVILQPNISGVGIDLKAVWRRVSPYFSQRPESEEK
ncbi:MAG: hypothetical protein KIS81_10970 [Maricaulaceae bacterium]|nr:hypothetical protein [Maricaulaceae bacterium]